MKRSPSIEHAAKVGECEYFDSYAPAGESGIRCFESTRETWCSVCLEKEPLWDDYQRKSALAGAALRSLLRRAKTIPPNVNLETGDVYVAVNGIGIWICDRCGKDNTPPFAERGRH